MKDQPVIDETRQEVFADRRTVVMECGGVDCCLCGTPIFIQFNAYTLRHSMGQDLYACSGCVGDRTAPELEWEYNKIVFVVAKEAGAF